MFIKSSVIALVLASGLPALARELIVERDGRAIYPRRFGQEHCDDIVGKLRAACKGPACGVLVNQVPGPLLGAADPCDQQDLADDIINAGKQQNAATAANMITLAIQFRQCERNTPPDYTKKPPVLSNSVYCLKAPKNSQLNGLVQAQDPASDPNLFFDVATRTTVLKGSQPNTFPFSGGAPDNAFCPVPAAPGGGPEPAAPATKANFNKCAVPKIAFGIFDGRTENSFVPVGGDFQHGSAMNPAIITGFICDQLVDKCDANTVAINNCAVAITATNGKSGQALVDAFNSAVSKDV